MEILNKPFYMIFSNCALGIFLAFIFFHEHGSHLMSWGTCFQNLKGTIQSSKKVNSSSLFTVNTASM